MGTAKEYIPCIQPEVLSNPFYIAEHDRHISIAQVNQFE